MKTGEIVADERQQNKEAKTVTNNGDKSDSESDENDEEYIVEDSETIENEDEDESSSKDSESDENNKEASKKSNASNKDEWLTQKAKKFILQCVCDTDDSFAEFCPGSCSKKDEIKIKKEKFRKLTLDAMKKFPAEMSSEEYYKLYDTTKEQKKQREKILQKKIKKIEATFKH
ncbi:hypothetical protein Ddc_13418 [Ditylenchus destructor]|nr:hypothetical protein Ddc_13418 [Ditylenchus destructor]